MRLAFAGTPEFARVALERLLDAGHELALVLTQPDRPAGRGMKLQASAVKQLAQQRGIRVVQPRSLRLDGAHTAEAAAAREAVTAARAEALIVAAYGLLLPAWTLALPKLGCLNIHASLLPRWRGAAPIHRAIEAGDAQTGICIMQMDEGLDTGAVLAARAEPIHADDTTASLHDRLAALGGALIVDVLRRIEAGAAPLPQVQPDEGVSYARKIEKTEAAFDWRASAAAIERRVRAFDPFPGTSFTWRGETVKLWRATVVEGAGEPGCVLAAGAEPVVACGRDALRLLQVQRAGGRRIAARELFEAPLAVGERLG